MPTICSGYDYGITTRHTTTDKEGTEKPTWVVYNANCLSVDKLDTSTNPCDSGKFGCSAEPIFFNKYTDPDGVGYSCSTDSRSEKCWEQDISVCVSIPLWDGRRCREIDNVAVPQGRGMTALV